MDIVQVFKKILDIDFANETFSDPDDIFSILEWLQSTVSLIRKNICDVRIILDYAAATGEVINEYIDSWDASEDREIIFENLAYLIMYMSENRMKTSKAMITNGSIGSSVNIRISRDSITEELAVHIHDIINGVASDNFICAFIFNEWKPFFDIEFTCPVRNADGDVLSFALLFVGPTDKNIKQIIQDMAVMLSIYGMALSIFDDPITTSPNEEQIKKSMLKLLSRTTDYSIPIGELYLDDPLQRFQYYVADISKTEDKDHVQIYEMIRNHESPKNICDAIDKIIDRILPDCKIQRMDNILSMLHMLFMVDDYPVGTKFDKEGPLVYVCKRTVERIRRLANFEVSSRFIVAERNYKASIMRNTALGYTYTKYLVFSDDDDIGCSINELVKREINGNPNHDNFAVFPISSASIKNYETLCGMWRYVINVPLARLLCFNNPPYLMTGEDAVTVHFFNHKIFESIADLNESTTRGNVGYIYMEASNRYTDYFMQPIERHIFEKIIMQLLSLSPSKLNKDEKAFILHGHMIDPKAKEYIVNGIGIRTELFEAVNEFTIFDTLNSDPDPKPYFAFATQRPSEDEVDAAPKTFPFTVIPRKASIDHDTGTVSYGDTEYSADEWNAFLRNQVVPSIKDGTMTTVFDNLIRGKEDIFEDVDIDDIIRPRLRVFGGKTTAFPWFKIFIIIIMIIVIIAVICIILSCINISINRIDPCKFVPII